MHAQGTGRQSLRMNMNERKLKKIYAAQNHFSHGLLPQMQRRKQTQLTERHLCVVSVSGDQRTKPPHLAYLSFPMLATSSSSGLHRSSSGHRELLFWASFIFFPFAMESCHNDGTHGQVLDKGKDHKVWEFGSS